MVGISTMKLWLIWPPTSKNLEWWSGFPAWMPMGRETIEVVNTMEGLSILYQQGLNTFTLPPYHLHAILQHQHSLQDDILGRGILGEIWKGGAWMGAQLGLCFQWVWKERCGVVSWGVTIDLIPSLPDIMTIVTDIVDGSVATVRSWTKVRTWTFLNRTQSPVQGPNFAWTEPGVRFWVQGCVEFSEPVRTAFEPEPLLYNSMHI